MFLCLAVKHSRGQEKDTALPVNTAIVPVPKLEEDSYDWWQRHGDVLRIKDSLDPEIVLIGNSITHFWGGLPLLKYKDGRVRNPNGPVSWQTLFDPYRVLNLGFGWDRTQNVLWRLDNGELDNLHPGLVIIEIGTNNTSATNHARMNTAAEIAGGISAICQRVRAKTPHARILLMAIFPREQSASNPRRILINQTNAILRVLAKKAHLLFIDTGKQWLAPNGDMLPGVTSDMTHPTEKGYAIWAAAIRKYVRQYNQVK
jgi:lysophospholipase L1-like esterase